ncbi:hypothetical protein A359_08870 [secondary endosymbiont of Ctenarytaina eucalypti]|uniref:Uncharacterized protein n=1 Tax=secondary endosymbiont of Ctenarytaina eucalypti TaxID=1199245 RepID=J3YSJ9_9ENTR|nr:hypothetical protein A359_08870 [secondary endosymbiont of Ctenarytaina eucalypti]
MLSACRLSIRLLNQESKRYCFQKCMRPGIDPPINLINRRFSSDLAINKIMVNLFPSFRS